MRIQRVFIEGYGGLSEREIAFAPELQIVVGPNERGKSTLRCFVCDMLYGQKRSGAQPLYDESNALRVPWNTPERYGGLLAYALGTGRLLEVHRRLGQADESIQVLDAASGEDVTNEFARLPNGEVDFAAAHLGLGKTVFLGVATIDHLNLESLGGHDALDQLREKLLALADSGGAAGSSEGALGRLAERIDVIGQPGASAKPLPQLRTCLADLDHEMAVARQAQQALAGIREERHSVLAGVADLRGQREKLEETLHVIEAYERRDRLREAEDLQSRIDGITQQCFTMGAVRDFPLGDAAELHRTETLANTARTQLERTLRERDELVRQLESEREALGQGRDGQGRDVPEEAEQRFAEAAAAFARLDERLAEMASLIENAEQRLDEAQRAVSEMPDFGSLSPDPVEWFTQLASSFNFAVQSRNEERAKREQIRKEVDQRRGTIAEPHALFHTVHDFQERARQYELHERLHSERLKSARQSLYALQGAEEEAGERVPQFFWLALLCLVGLGALVCALYVTGNQAVIWAGVVLSIAVLWFGGNWLHARARATQLAREIEETDLEVRELEEKHKAGPGLIEDLMRQGNYETVRELEAAYERYREANAELSAQVSLLRAQEEKTAENEERVPQMLERFRETFAKAGEDVELEEDVPRAAANTITRYQEYREAKRRLSDSRAVLEKHQNERKRLEAERETARMDLEDADEAMRRFMRESGFTEERDFENAGAALRGYRARAAKQRERHGRLALLEEKRRGVELQVQGEEAEREKHAHKLRLLLAKAGAKSADAWRAMAGEAQGYRELREKRSALNEQLTALLRGQEMAALRESVEGAGELPPRPVGDAEAVQQEIQTVSGHIDGAMDEEHGLHIRITEQNAATRPISEIEEERAAVTRQIDALDFEREAASHAMALIEETSRDRHGRLAPQLAKRASALITRITDGAYTELAVDPGLRVSVPIPHANRVEESPEKTLSKGTVDQVYLALRVALVQILSRGGEAIPMILDDPFANYDETRLGHAMRLMKEVGRDNQVLLFTCREEVVRAAECVEAPVLRL